MRRPSSSGPGGRLRGWARVWLLFSLLAQLGLAGMGWATLAAADWATILVWLMPWCLLGTFYLAVAVVVLTALSRSSGEAPPPAVIVSRPARALTALLTATTALVGIGAAILILVGKWDPTLGGYFEAGDHGSGVVTKVIGVWSMLLAWGFLHWGFAQSYFQRHYSSGTPQLGFPRTTSPSIVDFTYFAFCVGVSFAVSDVETITRRIRWRITCHSLLSYLFNGVIIVLAVNTILGSD